MNEKLAAGQYLGIIKVKTAAKLVNFSVDIEGNVHALGEQAASFEGALSQEELLTKVGGLIEEGIEIKPVNVENDAAYLENLIVTDNGKTPAGEKAPSIVDLNS